jgi:nucleoside-diphosphate-sugar epimerase
MTTSSTHVIVGAGPVGTTTALLLADLGHQVLVITRSGSGPTHPNIERIALDATNAAALSKATTGAAAIYNCVNPPYHRWPTDWPPIANAMLTAAESSGAVLVIMGNLYGYGPVTRPMKESDPLASTGVKGGVRIKMWRDALAAHESGRIRATEVRASDFIGPEVLNSHLGERVIPKLLQGKGVQVVGNPDMVHSFTFMPDVARALVTVATDERAWGKAWHVPTNPAISPREMITLMSKIAGVAPLKVSGIPNALLKVGGLFSPLFRELPEMLYQFDRPFIVDSSLFTSTFGLNATPLDEVLTATVNWYRGRPG